MSGSGGVRLTSVAVVNQRAFSNSCGLPLGALVDFSPPAALGLQRVGRAGLRCASCKAFLNQFCRIDHAKSQWQCALCSNANTAPAGILGSDISETPEAHVEAIEVTSQPPVPVPVPPPRHVVLVVDTNCQQKTLDNLSQALPAALQAELPSETLVSVVSIDGVVSLWPLTSGGGTAAAAAAAHPHSNGAPPPPPLPGQHQSGHGEPGAGSTLDDGASSPQKLLAAHVLLGEEAMDHDRVVQLQRLAPHLWLPLGQALAGGVLPRVLSALRPLHLHLPVRERPRCLAVGVEVALRLVAASTRAAGAQVPARGSRVLMITSGPPTVGPCSVPLPVLDHVGHVGHAAPAQLLEQARQHMASLAKMASSILVPVDVLAVESPCVNVALVAELTDATGGLLWHHRGDSPTLQESVQSTINRRWGSSAVLDCFVSPGLKVAQWLGPLLDLHEKVQEGALPPSLPTASHASPSACYVGHLCTGQGAAVRFELTRDLAEGEHAHVQVVLSYREPSTGAIVSRVVTHRLRVVGTVAALLAAIDPAAIGVELGKRVVTDALAAQAHRQPKALQAARQACAAALALLAARFGRAQATGGLLGVGVRRTRQLAGQLSHVALALYSLQRGAVLGMDAAAHGQQDMSSSAPDALSSASPDQALTMHPEARLLLMRAVLISDSAVSAQLLSPALFALMPCTPVDGDLPPSHANAAGLAQEQHHHHTPLVDAEAGKLRIISPFARLSSRGAGHHPAHVDNPGHQQAQPPQQRFRLVPLPATDLVLAATRHVAGSLAAADGEAAAAPGPVPKGGRLPWLLLDCGARLLVLYAGQAAEAQEQARDVAVALRSLGLTVHPLGRRPVPDVLAVPLLGPLQEPAMTLLAAGFAPVRYDVAKAQLAQLLEAGLSASNLALGMDGATTMVSQGALPWLYATATQLVSGALPGDGWARLAGSRPASKLPAADMSLLQWCSELGVVLPGTS